MLFRIQRAKKILVELFLFNKKLRYFLLYLIFLIVLLNVTLLYMRMNSIAESAEEENLGSPPIQGVLPTDPNEKIPDKETSSKRRKKPVRVKKFRGVTHEVGSSELNLLPEDITNVKEEIRKRNEEQEIRNTDTFGAPESDTTLVVIQVR